MIIVCEFRSAAVAAVAAVTNCGCSLLALCIRQVLSGTDLTPFETNNHHVPKTQLYGLTHSCFVNHVLVRVRYMYLLFPTLLRSGTDKLAQIR